MSRIDRLCFWLIAAVAIYLPLQTLVPDLTIQARSPERLTLILSILPELLILFGLLVVAVDSLRKKSLPFTPTRLDAIVISLLLWAALTSLWAGHSLGQDIVGLRLDFDGLLGFLLARSLKIGAKELKFLGRVMLWQITALVGSGLLLWALFPRDLLGRLGFSPAFHVAGKITQAQSIFSGPNQMATALTLFAALTIPAVLLAAKRRPDRGAQLLLVAIGLLSGLSYSRSGWMGLGLLLGVVAVLLLTNRSTRWIWPVLVGIAVAASALFGMLRYHDDLQTVLQHKKSTAVHVSAAGQDLGRVVSPKHRSRTVFGEGVGSAGPASYRLKQPLIEESWYFQLIDEVGFIGLGLWLLLIGLVFWRWIRIRSALIQGLALALSGISLNAVFLHVWSDNYYIQISFWLIVGLLWQREQETERILFPRSKVASFDDLE